MPEHPCERAQQALGLPSPGRFDAVETGYRALLQAAPDLPADSPAMPHREGGREALACFDRLRPGERNAIPAAAVVVIGDNDKMPGDLALPREPRHRFVQAFDALIARRSGIAL